TQNSTLSLHDALPISLSEIQDPWPTRRGNTAMKENNATRVLVREGSTSLTRRHARAREPFTTVSFEETKRAATVAYGTFWYIMRSEEHTSELQSPCNL